MGFFTDAMETVNDFQLDTFDAETILYQPKSPDGTNNGPQVQIRVLQVDPMRLEYAAPGNYVLRWCKQSDFNAVNVAPVRGDQVLLGVDNPDLYVVHQVQEEEVTGGGVTLVLNRVEDN